MKKTLSFILVLSLLCSLFAGAAFAAGASDYSMTTSGAVTVDGSEDKTVSVYFNSAAAGTYYALQGDWSLKETEDSSYLTLTSLTAGGNATATENDPATGHIYWMDITYVGFAVAAGSPIWTATYTVDKDTPTGDYTVSFEVAAVTGGTNGYDSDSNVGTLTAKINVTNNTPGYTVNMTASASTVDTNGTVDINLDVTNSDASTFNAFYSTLTYDAAKFTYDEVNSVLGDFNIDVECDEGGTPTGKLIISRSGTDVTIPGSGAELTLRFNAGTTDGVGNFVLGTTKVDVANKANEDAAAATVIGSPKSVTVKAAEVAKYTVTFDANGHGTAPAAITNVVSGSPITAPTAPTADGYTFGGWYTESACTTAWDFASDTVTSDITLYAKWTENEAAVDTVTLNTSYLSGYTLIGITVKDADGKVPQYNSNTMYKVTNVPNKSTYNADTYYYVVSGTVTDEDAVKGAVSFGTGSAETITKTGDANCTNLVDINDAQFIYNLYNNMGTTYTVNAKQLLSSDVNGDGTVTSADCATAVAAIQ